MAKNLVRNNRQPKALEKGVADIESKAASGNLVAEAAYSAPLIVNREREQMHLGNRPQPGSGKF